MTQHLDTYLSATQLGVTITSLALGWLGDPTFKRLFDNLFENFNLPSSVSSLLSIVISFSVLTFIQVIVGELVPKNFAINKTEKIGLLIARPTNLVSFNVPNRLFTQWHCKWNFPLFWIEKCW